MLFPEEYIRLLPCMRKSHIYHCLERCPTIQSEFLFQRFSWCCTRRKFLQSYVLMVLQKVACTTASFKKSFQLVDVREISSAFQPELKNSCVLAAWAVQLYSQSLVLSHCLIKYFWKCCAFLRTKLFQFCYYVVRLIFFQYGQQNLLPCLLIL